MVADVMGLILPGQTEVVDGLILPGQTDVAGGLILPGETEAILFTQPPADEFGRLALLPGALIVDITSVERNNSSWGWEFEPQQGTLHRKFPANMLVDTDQQALERIRGNTSGQQFHIHRGSFGDNWNDFLPNVYDNGNLYVIDVNLEIYVRFEIIAGGYAAGGGFVNFLENIWIVGANTLASDDSDALVTILNTLRGRRIIVAMCSQQTGTPYIPYST